MIIIKKIKRGIWVPFLMWAPGYTHFIIKAKTTNIKRKYEQVVVICFRSSVNVRNITNPIKIYPPSYGGKRKSFTYVNALFCWQSTRRKEKREDKKNIQKVQLLAVHSPRRNQTKWNAHTHTQTHRRTHLCTSFRPHTWLVNCQSQSDERPLWFHQSVVNSEKVNYIQPQL